VNKLIEILTVYRQNYGFSTPPNQVALPESLRALPLYMLACAKNIIFRSTTPITPDLRSYNMQLFRMLPVELGCMFVYPRFYALHNLPEQYGLEDENGNVNLPNVLNLSSEKLDRNGLFLLDNGQVLLMRICKAIDPNLLHQLFGTVDLTQVPLNKTMIQENPSLPPESLVNRVAKIIFTLQNNIERVYFPRLYIFREGDAMDLTFMSYLIEDRTNNVYSYQEFLIQLQRATNKSK